MSKSSRGAVLGWSADPDAVRKFNDLHHMAIRRLAELRNHTWEENAFLPEHYPDLTGAVDALRWLVVRHLFREAGDAKCTAVILNGLRSEVGAPETPAEAFFRELSAYVANALVSDAQRPAEARDGISLGLAVWGESYVARVARYSLASLAAGGNVPHALAQGAVTGMVQTREQDAHAIAELLRARFPGMNPAIRTFPDVLLEALSAPEDPRYGPLKYWLLGAAQTLHLSAARQRGDAVFSVFPDCLYSSNYVAELMRLMRAGADAVLLSGFAARERGVAGMLGEPSSDGIYAVPATQLLDAALRNVFPKFRSIFAVADMGTLPRHLALFFYCGDQITIHSPHYNLAALAARACAGVPSRFFMTLDSEIDKLADARSVHLHDLDDDYFATEIRPDDSDGEACPRISEAEFVEFAIRHLNDIHVQLFRRSYRLACAPGFRYDLPVTETGAVESFMQRVGNAVRTALVKPRPDGQQAIVAEIRLRAGIAPAPAAI